jgi:hypothetical protein
MKDRAQELRAAARRGQRVDKADAERAVLAQIAELPESDRAMAERLHAIVTASAPVLSPRLWYGMPAYARDGKDRRAGEEGGELRTEQATAPRPGPSFVMLGAVGYGRGYCRAF